MSLTYLSQSLIETNGILVFKGDNQMAICKCRECGRDVSSSAKICPGCGVKNPGVSYGVYLSAFLLVAILAIIAGFSSCKNNNDPPISENKQAIVTQPIEKKVDVVVKKAQPLEPKVNINAKNPKVESCLNNVGDDVKTKSFSANTFSGNKCGVTRYGTDGIGLNIYNSFYQENLADKDYALQMLRKIALKYGYKKYSILISDNEAKLMMDREVETHPVE